MENKLKLLPEYEQLKCLKQNRSKAEQEGDSDLSAKLMEQIIPLSNYVNRIDSIL